MATMGHVTQPTDVSITVPNDESGDLLAELYKWVCEDEPSLRARVELVDAGPRPGEMSGGIPVALEAALLSKELLAALVGAVGGYLSARVTARRTTIRVRRGEREVEIDTTNLKDAEELAAEIYRGLGETA